MACRLNNQSTRSDQGQDDFGDEGWRFSIAHDGRQSFPGVKVHAQVEFTLALAAQAGRSWPQERLDLILRECFHHVEEILREVESFIDSGRLTPNLTP